MVTLHGSVVVCALAPALLVTVMALAGPGPTARGQAWGDLLAGRFHWRVSQPLVAPLVRPDDVCFSVKDPSVVFFDGRWHLFCSIRGKKRSHQIEDELLTHPAVPHKSVLLPLIDATKAHCQSATRVGGFRTTTQSEEGGP